jgi:hypothetical protein
MKDIIDILHEGWWYLTNKNNFTLLSPLKDHHIFTFNGQHFQTLDLYLTHIFESKLSC